MPARRSKTHHGRHGIRRLTSILAVLAVLAATRAGAAEHIAEIDASGTTLRISISERLDERTASALIEWLRTVAGDLRALYGRFPLAELRVRLVPRRGWRADDAAVSFGRVTRRGGEAIELYINPDRPIDEFYGDWTAPHEFSHLLLPAISWRQRWISEGFASYYQNVLLARAGRYTPDTAIRKLREGFDRGRASRPELSPNEASREGIRRARYKIYWSGAAIALLADLALRERSGGRDSLDAVLGRFQACCLPSQRRWSGVEFFATLDELAGEPVFLPLYRRYADRPGFPDVDAALANPVLRDNVFAVRNYTD